jgi:hypothetical protein
MVAESVLFTVEALNVEHTFELGSVTFYGVTDGIQRLTDVARRPQTLDLVRKLIDSKRYESVTLAYCSVVTGQSIETLRSFRAPG